MYALDTNSVIFSLKGKGQVRQRLAATLPSEVCVPAIVVYELEFGSLGSLNPARRRRDLRLLLSSLEVIPFDEKAAEHTARIRHHLEQSGKRLRPLDTLIAGTALARGAVLVTNNISEFSRVPGLEIEDWF